MFDMLLFEYIANYRDILGMGQTVGFYIVRIRVLAHSDLLISITCNHMTVARRQNLIQISQRCTIVRVH